MSDDQGCFFDSGCPMTEPHGHCSGQGCIVSLVEDGKVCGECDRAIMTWQEDEMRREAKRIQPDDGRCGLCGGYQCGCVPDGGW